MADRGPAPSALVLPGLAAADGSTVAMRAALARRGIRTHGWNLGRNVGPSDRLMTALRSRLSDLVERSEKPIALVGWSMGGHYAHLLAEMAPEHVRAVVTLGEPAVIPVDPEQRFFSLLVEDYAEEWLWRPAMHFRWSYRRDALQLSRTIVDEALTPVRLPGAIKRAMIRRRQIGGWATGDGVTDETWDHIEGCYHGALARLSTILEPRPFLLGERPTVADFGYFASMFRHFALDPTPSHIMRETAPHVWEWVARMWNARASTTNGPLVEGVPADWGPILDQVGSAYLPYLNANARGWAVGAERHDVELQGIAYRQLPVSRYRVWVLEQLRENYDAVPDDAKPTVRERLAAHGCWEPLWEIDHLASGYDGDNVPFRGEKVHYPGHRFYG